MIDEAAKEAIVICSAMLAYNEDNFGGCAGRAAAQAMPLLLARGEHARLSQEIVLLEQPQSAD